MDIEERIKALEAQLGTQPQNRMYKTDPIPGSILPSALVATSTPAKGDLHYSDGSVFQNIPIGSSGQLLTIVGNVPAWTTYVPSSANFSNPYKFSVYRNAAQNSGSGADAIVNFDTKNFDTGSNVDIVTNVGRFTAPIAGFYFITATVKASTTSSQYVIASIYKNGSVFSEGTKNFQTAQFIQSSVVSGLLQLAINDYIEIYSYGDGGALTLTNKGTHFDGFLVSKT